MSMIRQFFAVPAINTSDISLHGVGIQENMHPGIIDRPAGTGDYLIMFFYNEIDLRIDGDIDRYPGGTLMVWTPGQEQYYGNTDFEQHWCHSWIHCNGDAVGRFIEESAIPTNVPFAFSDPQLFERYLLALYQEATHVMADVAIARNHLQSLFLEIRRATNRDDQIHTLPPRKLLDCKRYLEEHYNEPLTLTDLAARAHLSVPHFCNQFKRYFGVSAIDYLIHVRMHQAAYFLRNQSMNITGVASRVGYADIYYFSKLFKRHYGISPRAMRKEQLLSPEVTESE